MPDTYEVHLRRKTAKGRVLRETVVVEANTWHEAHAKVKKHCGFKWEVVQWFVRIV